MVSKAIVWQAQVGRQNPCDPLIVQNGETGMVQGDGCTGVQLQSRAFLLR